MTAQATQLGIARTTRDVVNISNPSNREGVHLDPRLLVTVQVGSHVPVAAALRLWRFVCQWL